MKILQSSPNPLIQLTKFWQKNYILLRELKYFPKVVVLAFIFSFLASASDGIGIGVILSFLQSLINQNNQISQTGIDWFDIWVLGINETVNNRLYRLSVLIILIIWLRSLFHYLQVLYLGIVRVTLIDRLRKKIFEHFQQLSLNYFSKIRSGELINSITTELNELQMILNWYTSLVVQWISLLVYAFAIIAISWQLSLLALLLLALLSIGLSTLRKRVREVSFAISKANGHFTSVAVEFLSGIFTIHAFATQEYERRRFYKASNDIAIAQTNSLLKSAVVGPLGGGVGTTVIILIILIGITGLNMPVARLLTFLYALMRLIPMVHGINNVATQISQKQGSLININELLRTDNKPYFQNGKVLFTGLKQKLDFVSVGFSYDDTSTVLHKINLEIKKGQMTALVGASGAGKSTLAALIPRFYDPQQGQILIDGVDVREFEINSLRKNIGVVSQDTFIFNASVKDNIAYGTEGANDQQIRQAAELAHAIEFIQELPEGFESLLGDRGVRLSGGQRQRIAIARAILKDPQILILDEATSALDSKSERLIQEALEKLSVNRTVIAIAHRLSTIAKAEQVVVLEQGCIVEQGSYQELIKIEGKLWSYHQLQQTPS
ncbi:MAG: ABC transporter ATP-binding protein [Symploca sp. SIO3C6]|uniref:ABC transporter ATP-binding protein n=1 Tax=Symploca sp. SIO1C4 TaxID=2607765 RepID=A0A6B3NAK8_9CYAN|nr:ABC transporter ATP-binding protein [Symploca sp. SIO3C6]NER28697.1 ABC transporter ATP-binding protein [Symploca sp. SIO1C4]